MKIHFDNSTSSPIHLRDGLAAFVLMGFCVLLWSVL